VLSYCNTLELRSRWKQQVTIVKIICPTTFGSIYQAMNFYRRSVNMVPSQAVAPANVVAQMCGFRLRTISIRK
jgi:hypothetical protein